MSRDMALKAPPTPPQKIGAHSFFPILEILKVAASALGRHWGRSVLTALGMVVGTACLVLVVVAGISGRNYTLEQIRGIGSNLISVYQEAADAMLSTYTLEDRLNTGDLNAIRQVPGVHSAAPLMLSYPSLYLEGVGHVVTLIGTTPEYESVRNIAVVSGRFLDENDESFRSKVCLVTELLAKSLQRDPFYKGNITLYGIQFTVIGVFRERVSTFGQAEVSDYAAILPLSVMRYFKPAGTLDQIYVSAESLETVPQVTSVIKQLLPSRHRQRALYKVDNLTEILKAASRISLGLTLVLLVIAFISMLASGIGIMNVMLITVTERTREIGIKKSVGALRRLVLIEFLAEAMLLTVGGGSVGVLIGVGVPYLVEYFEPGIRIQIPPLAVILGFGMTLVVGLTFGMLPAIRAARMNPIEALRYE
jgi:putative ABC transport system permease protein